jgi:hypothetical protein
MRWDDLQPLRSIDEMEQGNAHAGNGHYLLCGPARRQGIPWGEEIASFASELELAHNTGFLACADRSSKCFGTYSPISGPNIWLQTIKVIKLFVNLLAKFEIRTLVGVYAQAGRSSDMRSSRAESI